MITIIITLAGLLVVAIISNAVFSRLLKKSLKSQSFFYDLYRREQRDCLRIEEEKRILEKELQDRTKTIELLRADIEKEIESLGGGIKTINFTADLYKHKIIEILKEPTDAEVYSKMTEKNTPPLSILDYVDLFEKTKKEIIAEKAKK